MTVDGISNTFIHVLQTIFPNSPQIEFPPLFGRLRKLGIFNNRLYGYSGHFKVLLELFLIAYHFQNPEKLDPSLSQKPKRDQYFN